MRKITLSLFALLVTIVAYCGAPQAFNYQAVAMSSNGTPLKLKGVAFRLSILDGGSAGTLVYQERQSATTDNAGLVSLQIGNGTTLSGTFSTVDWSKGVFFLKAEIDTLGGTSYNNLGSAQFFSVPYALYAQKTSLPSQEFPDGLDNITPVRLDGSFSYVVPSGQTLYITQIAHNTSASCSTYGVNVDGISLVSGSAPTTGVSSGAAPASTYNSKISTVYPLAIPEGQAITSLSCGTSLVGFTVIKGYSWVLFDLNTGNYTVPAGKIFVLKNMLASASSGWKQTYTVNGMTTTYNQQTASFVDAAQTITASGLSGSLLMMGYLKNK